MSDIEDGMICNHRIGYKRESYWVNLIDRWLKNSRYCSECNQEVVRCTTVKQLKKALELHACAVIPIESLVGKSRTVGEIQSQNG